MILTASIAGTTQARSRAVQTTALATSAGDQRFAAAPPLASGVWANGAPTTIADQRGKVVLLAFWTHECINCQRTIPFWNNWVKRYGKASGVTVLSVHTPELASERKIENVRRYTREKGIVFPVVTDNDYASWKAYNVNAWPTTILIDKQGRVRDRWEGELGYEKSGEYRNVERAIEALRKEK